MLLTCGNVTDIRVFFIAMAQSSVKPCKIGVLHESVYGVGR